MKQSMLKSVAVVAAGVFTIGAQAADQVLTFDDINFTTGASGSGATHTIFGSTPADKIAVFNNPTAYYGFNFGTLGSSTNPWYAAEDICPTCILTSNEYGASSGDTVVAVDNRFAPSVSGDFDPSPAITSTTPFRFIGAAFTGGISNGTNGNKVKYELLDQFGATIATTADLTATQPALAPTGLLTNRPVFISNPLSGTFVYGVRIQSKWALYAMDDFTFNTAPIPEPATYAMLLAGLGVVGAMARRRRA